MGGESTKSLALAVMRAAANNFFSLKTEIPPLETRKIRLWHAELSRYTCTNVVLEPDSI
jgi:hypothetical protein